MSFVKTAQEYLNVVKTGLKNADKIIEAMHVSAQIKNGDCSEEALAEILRRKDICASCNFNSENAKKFGYETSLGFTHCIHCSCRIGGDDTKEYCLSCTCGIDIYNKRNPDKKMEVKWFPFEIEKTVNNTPQ